MFAGVLAALAGTPGWAQERITISHMFWGDPVGLGFVAAKAAFEAANPDIEIELLHQPGGYKDQLQIYMATGTGPDTFALDHQDIVAFVRSGWAVDLTPYVERTPEFRVDEFLPPVRDIGIVDGMEVGFANGTATNMYYYNEKLFIEAGLETPLELFNKDGWTWEAFREAARRLTRRDPNGDVVAWGSAVHVGGALVRGWIWSNGGLEVDDVKNPSVALWDSSESIEALDFLQQLIHGDEAAMLRGDATAAFVSGNLAMYARWNSGFVFHAEAPFEWGIVPYPKGPSPTGKYAADLTAAIFAMSPYTKNPEAAWKWIAFATSYEGNLFRLQGGGGMPSRISFTAEDIAQFQPPNLVNPEMLFLALQIGQSRIMSPNQADVLQAANSELNKILNNEVPAAVGAAAAAELANAVIASGR